MYVPSVLIAFAAIAGVQSVTGSALPHATFHYEITSSMRRVEDGCRMCYGDDCLPLAPARCEYYMEVDELTERPDQDGEGSQIDAMVSELTEQATISWLAQECIPLISLYTTCNKENLCVGCETCHCSATGRWSCNQVQRCRAEPEVTVEHPTLVVVIEKLLEDDKKVRRKRFIENEIDKPNVTSISLKDIAEWMYEETPTINVSLTSDTTTELTNTRKTPEIYTQSTILTTIESENLGFEEVLRNIADDQIYKRRKSQLYENSEIDADYMDLEDGNTTKNNTSVNFMEMLNNIEDGKNITESTGGEKFVIDLYPREYKHNYDDYNETELEDGYFLPKDENNTIDILPENADAGPVNVMKRDVSFVTDSNNTTKDTTIVSTIFDTTTPKINDLENHVLKPLSNIINDKENELRDLIQIRDSLITIMGIVHNKSAINITKEHDKINSSTRYSIYKLDLYPEVHESLRMINPNVMSKLLYKLKRDIYEVFRDIARIQKLSKTEGLPDDLRLLIRSMKYYVSKQGNIHNMEKNETEMQNFSEPRKFWLRRNLTNQTSIVRQFVDILEEIDKGEPQSEVFSNSSQSTKKIIKRVIKENYGDEFLLPGMKTHDSEYNLTDDLKTIGNSWPQLTAKLVNSSPHETLYALKLFHFTLAGDINKLTGAIALLNFVHSRRMTPIETPMAHEVMDKINSGLLSIQQKIKSIVKYQAIHNRNQLRKHTDIKKHKKESFLKRIRNMLKSSKNEIFNMVKDKVPKTEIFRAIAEKKLHELSKNKTSADEHTMLKWQKSLNISRRRKRDVATHVKNIKSRIKSILPKYLRRTINPAMIKNKTKKITKKIKKKNKQKNATSPTRRTNKKIAAVSKKHKTAVNPTTKSSLPSENTAKAIAGTTPIPIPY